MTSRLALVLLAAGPLVASPFDRISDTSVAEIAAHFASPPPHYSSQITWGWNGVMTREVIARDLDRIKALNLHQVWIEPGRNPEAAYLSPAYFENVKIAVEEAKRRDMYVWFDDDGGYPSGFAGGKFTEQRPDLGMKALLPPERVTVAAGQLFERIADDRTICFVAENLDDATNTVLTPEAGHVRWTAPARGHWTVSIVRWEFRSGPTRSANNRSGTKDNEHALMDYLSPEANRLFIAWTFEQYQRAVGNEFGQTFLGFRGDEAAFGFNPWTPELPAEFQQRKGYDIRPYLPAIAAIQIGHTRAGAAPVETTIDAAHRAYADYCDVWSDLFGQNFFAADAAWCANHGLVLQHHIEHEEILPQLAIANGDYFKCLGAVQVPGVDVIWHQMWHDVVADFPKLASSAAHLNGHPQAMSETFAAMGGNYPTPNLDEARWILLHQVALGITHFEYMFLPSSAPRASVPGNPPRRRPPPSSGIAIGDIRGAAPAGYRYLNDPGFPALAAAVNRATYVLAQGRPAAQLGVYLPSSSFWFGDTAVNRSFVALVHALLEHQRDLDFIDDASLARNLAVKGPELVNASGQAYRAILVPPAVALSASALDKLHTFAAAGGKAIFLGARPQLVVSRSFREASPPPQLTWATAFATTEVTPALLAALPAPDLIATAAPGLKYNHRRLSDADVYFLFNEGDTSIEQTITLACSSSATHVEEWNTSTGVITPIAGAALRADRVIVPIQLAPWATELIVLRTRADR